MRRPALSFALLVALPLAVPLACSDDVGSAGAGGSGGVATSSGPTTTTEAGPTTTSTGNGSTSSTSSAADGGGSSVGGGTSSGGAGPGGVGGSGVGGSGVGAGGVGGSGVGGNGNGGAGQGGDTTTSSASGPVPTTEVMCQNQLYQCGDLDDNDLDGLIDSQDPECLGPCDNDESSLNTEIPGGDGPACAQDCFFDGNSGDGNDDCNWDHRCDPISLAPDYYPEPNNGDACAYIGADQTPPSGAGTCGEMIMEFSPQCESYCAPLVPNGCDCFGCCELPAGGGEYVWLGSRGASGDTVCSFDEIDNPEVCHPCTPVQGACFNACEPCEICIGAPLPDPVECNPGGTGGGGSGAGGSPGQQCDGGVQPCGLEGQDPCAAGFACITGCCVAAPT